MVMWLAVVRRVAVLRHLGQRVEQAEELLVGPGRAGVRVARGAVELGEELGHLPERHGDEPTEPIHRARLALVAATRRVLANGLSLLGVTAPEQM